MAARGLRSVLQPVLFVGIAAILHGILFLIPSGAPGKRAPDTSRGIRVKTYVDGPRAAPLPPPAAARTAESVADAATPTATDSSRAVTGTDVARSGASQGGGQGDEGGPRGGPGASQGPTPGSGGPATRSEFGQYLDHLRSDGVQGWARQSAKASRQGWKASSPGSKGWGQGTGTGNGSGPGSGRGRGGGRGRTAGEAIMDPRVRMVVIQYPLDDSGRAEVGRGKNIENQLPPVPYPDLRVKQAQFTSGWWNVYIELWTTKDGQVARFNVLRPETNGPLERVFVDQVKRELPRWTFDPGVSEVHADVRFYVE